MLFSKSNILSVVASVAAFSNSVIADEIPTGDKLQSYIDKWTSHPTNTDQQIIDYTLENLYTIGNSSLTDCEKCVSNLSLGKSLAMVRPDLVGGIWVQYCKETKAHSQSNCELYYERNTVENSGYGTNFVNLLTLMDPQSLDGQYYCFFRDGGKCACPETPDVSLSNLWPEKPAKAYTAPEVGDELINVLHISDFHVQLDYVIGGEANCSKSMCCTPHSKPSKKVPKGYDYLSSLTDDEKNGVNFYDSSYVDGVFTKGDQQSFSAKAWFPAPAYGHYECDAPEVLINSSLDSIIKYQEENNITFDFTIFTGDLVDHDEKLYTSYERTLESEEVVFRDIKYKLKDIPVYAVLGNHDTFPYGEMAQQKSGFDNMFNWNAKLMAEMWKDFEWIGADQVDFVKTHYTGFSIVTKDGLKVISLNSNCWFYNNHYAYWNMTQDVDSFGQFDFLINELVDSEKNDQRVWIISHIPVSQSTLPIQSKLFGEVVERFSPYTIAHIFQGHTHRDEFQILYKGDGKDDSEKTAENVIANTWISQAVTPWVENNPAWRYYQVDKKTFSIMDSLNFYTKLNDTYFNFGEEPVWEFEYSGRKDYGIEWPENAPLNATYWHLVSEKMNSDVDTLQTYENFAKRFSPFTTDCKDGSCDTNWCYVTSFTYDQYENCLAAHNLSS
ncbi:hypothetical protein B5S31_g3207 [[Candida] boidinii]|nr:hypothetical protein B5S31_g3207 [[Candida] boidinii]OWB79645.1 hypothetical protein B5S32_g3875 [[Candida] boidinii]